MCGIAGWFGSGSTLDSKSLVEALSHRGPDGSGVWASDHATLVHTRLAILDLSEAGKQPMVWSRGVVGGREGSKSTRVELEAPPDVRPADLGPLAFSTAFVLVFNGEIYNHDELRKALESDGESFVGHSDSEVLLRLLVRDGAACLPRLAGMFAFAFWDEAKGEALMARDAYGIKPLYYRSENSSLTFASETGVLKLDGDHTDATSLRDYFLWGSVPEPATLNESVRQLPAGHLMRWKNGECRIEPWHQRKRPEPRIQNPDTFSKHSRPFASIRGSDCASLVRAALEESMRRHLVSDVPVGIFLSGGIDSTVVLALTRQALGPDADIRTFSIGFDDPEFDESGIARRTAEHFGARHTEWRMTAEEGAAEIPGFLAAADQPSIDGFNTWCVSKLARREGMKVVLSGLGGDEWFAGYGSFKRVPQFHQTHRMLGPLRSMVAAVLDKRPVGSPWRRLAAFFRGGGSWLEAFHAQRGIFTAKEAEQLAKALTGKAPASSAFSDSCLLLPVSCFLSSNSRAIVSEMEVTRYMRNQLLRDSDVFSMAHGLELRVPFVDVLLAETLLSLPPEIRLQQGKQLLLDAVPEVPEWVRNQPKRGFRFPFQQWMEDQFGELVESAETESPILLNAWYRTWALAVAMRALR